MIEEVSPGTLTRYGGGRAAVLRAVENPGQHDERGGRRQAEGERQQHRHRGERRDAGQHADQRADHHAGKAEQQVLPGRRRGEAERQIVEQLHAIMSRSSCANLSIVIPGRPEGPGPESILTDRGYGFRA